MNGTISREGSRWRARYYAPNRRRVSKSFGRKRDAERWLAAQAVDHQRGRWVDEQKGRLPYGDWVERWWATTVASRPSTRERDRNYLDYYILPQFDRWPLASIRQPDVAAWVAALANRGLAPATVKKALQIFGRTMKDAVHAEMIAAAPLRGVRAPSVEADERRFLTATEVARLADCIHPRYRALVLVGGYGGLRIGELAGLRVGRVDELRSTVAVAEILVDLPGRLVFGPPKTRAGRRSVPLPRPVMSELRTHIDGWSDPHDPEALVFTAPRGGPLRPTTWRPRFWKPAVAAAGIAGIQPHGLRHTAVALWIAGGATPVQVARRAGHSSTSVVLDRYGHLYPEGDDQLDERLSAAYASAAAEPAGDVRRLAQQ